MADEYKEASVPIDPQKVPPPPPPAPAEDETIILPAQPVEREVGEETVERETPAPPPSSETVPPQPAPSEPSPKPAPLYTQEQDFLLKPYTDERPAGPSAMALTWRAIWESPLKTWRGRPMDALDQAHEVEEKTGNSWVVWATTLAVNSVLLALILTVLVARGFALLYQLTSDGFPGYGPRFSFGHLLLIFLLTAIMFAVGLAARATGLYLTQRVSGATVDFQRAATSYAASQMLYTVPLAVVAVLALVGAMGFAWPLVAVGAAGLGITVLIFNYIAILRDGPHRFSPLIPFAWFAVLAALVAGTVQGLVLGALL